MRRLIDRTNFHYGRLIVLKRSSYTLWKPQISWWCECSCKNELSILVPVGYLTSGDVKSCGCLFDETVIQNYKTLQTWRKKRPLLTKEQKLLGRRQYYHKNRERILAQKSMAAKTPHRMKKRREQEKLRCQTNIQFRLAKSLRTRLRKVLKFKKKIGSHIKDLGCSVEFLKNYLELQFKPGMTWNNWGIKKGNWTIDHIIPLSHFDLTIREEFLKAVNYKNLKPEWNSINFSKGNRYVG